MSRWKGREARRQRVGLVFAVLLVGAAATGHASELTTADRLAMLYSPQLQFSVDGDPLIKIGLLEGQSRITFVPSTPIVVLPMGEGGPEIGLPGGHAYTVELVDGSQGSYRYWATVARGMPSERDRLAALQRDWEAQGFEARRFNLGSIFAVRGTMFDNRQTILGVGGVSARDEAATLARRLEDERGIPADLHVELVDYPSGLLRLSADGLEVTIAHRDLLWIASSGGGTFQLDGELFARPGREPTDRTYVGSLIFTLDRHGGLAMVNELPVERLLEGIVPAEIYASAPIDALRSQAVAARGELLADLGVRYLADPFMTCATQRCQVYAGVGAEHPRTSQAIRDTRGLVLLYDDHLARTVYSASNGGSIGDFAATWGHEPLPYLQPRIDAQPIPGHLADGLDEALVREFLTSDLDTYANIDDFGGTRTYRWSLELAVDELSEAVAERYDVGRVVDLEVLERDASGRAVLLRIAGRDREVVVERELPIRRALGGLRSALFVVDVERDGSGELQSARLQGGGFGHGVGMCQTGAIGAAQRGVDYLSILAHYYPGTEAVRLWE